MEKAPEEVKTLKKWEQNDLDLINKHNSIRSDPESRSFGFSHGKLVLRSKSLTIFGNSVLSGLAIVVSLEILDFFKRVRTGPTFYLFHFRIHEFDFEMVAYFAGAAALSLAFTLFGFSRRRRSIWIGIYFVLMFIAPMWLFHWPYMGK